MKRLLSVFLAITLLLALAVVPASADDAAGAITPDTSWFSKDKEEYEIGTAAEFLGFLELAQTPANFYHKTVRLTADIDLNPGVELKVKYQDGKYTVPAQPANVWKTIKSLQGTIDGNGHVLSGIYSNPTTNGSVKEFALIHKAENGGSVKNLIIKNSILYVTGENGENMPWGGMKIAGLVYELYGTEQSPSVLENLYLDLDVCYKGPNTDVSFGGVSYWTSGGPILFRNVVYAGCLGGINSDQTATLQTSQKISQLVNYLATGSNMDKSFDNIALIGSYICGDNGANAPVIANADDWKRVQGIKGDGKGPVNAHIVSGRFDSLEAAAAAGKYYNFKNPDASLNTETDMTYYAPVGAVIPTKVATMIEESATIRVVGVQRSDASYVAGTGEDTYEAQSLRFVAAIRLPKDAFCKYEKVGFSITIKEDGKESTLVKDGNTVYTSITANGKTVTAQEYNADYLIALSVNNVPIGGEIELLITPYLLGVDGVQQCGTAVRAKVMATGSFEGEN